jgi:hypothetical protein
VGVVPAARNTLRCEKPAPERDPAPLDCIFLAALLRAAEHAHGSSARVANEIAAATGALNQQFADRVTNEVERRAQDLLVLQESLHKFEAASGVKIVGWRVGDIGAAVKLVLDTGEDGVFAGARRLRDSLDTILRAHAESKLTPPLGATINTMTAPATSCAKVGLAADPSQSITPLDCGRSRGVYSSPEREYDKATGDFYSVHVVFIGGTRPAKPVIDGALRDCLAVALTMDANKDIVANAWYREKDGDDFRYDQSIDPYSLAGFLTYTAVTKQVAIDRIALPAQQQLPPQGETRIVSALPNPNVPRAALRTSGTLPTSRSSRL